MVPRVYLAGLELNDVPGGLPAQVAYFQVGTFELTFRCRSGRLRASGSETAVLLTWTAVFQGSWVFALLSAVGVCAFVSVASLTACRRWLEAVMLDLPFFLLPCSCLLESASSLFVLPPNKSYVVASFLKALQVSRFAKLPTLVVSLVWRS